MNSPTKERKLLALLTPRAATGWPAVEDRQVINGMVYKFRTGISWCDLPDRYGPWKTVYTRFRRYALNDVFPRALQQVQAHADAPGEIDWLVQIDSTMVRSHQHAAGAGRKRGQPMQGEPDDHALGRSRGGPTTKIPLACDGKGRPFAILVTPGQRHDSVYARLLLVRIRFPRTGPGRLRCRPDRAIADKAYSSRGFCAFLYRRGVSRTSSPKDRSATAPTGPRPTRRQTTRIHRGDLLPTQHHRALLQPAQRLPRHRHRIREDRHLLRSSGHARVIPALDKIHLTTELARTRRTAALPRPLWL